MRDEKEERKKQARSNKQHVHDIQYLMYEREKIERLYYACIITDHSYGTIIR